MSEVKTYDLEDTGSAYQEYREMVVQTEYEGDWVRIEDYKQLESENKRLRTNLDESSDLLVAQKMDLVNCKAENKRLRDFKNEVMNLINNSDGVAGWHLNGDVATWDECLSLELKNDQS